MERYCRYSRDSRRRCGCFFFVGTEGEIMMWKCKNCGAENGDASSNCVSCGERRTTASAKSTAVKNVAAQSAAASSPGTEGKKYVQGNCWQANDLEKWGGIIWIVCIVLAGLRLLLSFFDSSLWEEVGQSLWLHVITSGLLPAICWIIGGYASKLLLESFALIVEAAYKFIHFHE